MSKKMITVAEAARLRGCSLTAVRLLLLRGRLPSAKKVAGKWLIDLQELKEFYALVDFWRDRHPPASAGETVSA